MVFVATNSVARKGMCPAGEQQGAKADWFHPGCSWPPLDIAQEVLL